MASNGSPNLRFVEPPRPVAPLRVRRPLRVLVVVSDPVDSSSPGRDAGAEKQRLLDALAAPIRDGGLVAETLATATLQELHRALRRGEFHVLHFAGPAARDPRTGEASLVLEGPDRRGRPVSASALGALLQEQGSMRVALLQSGDAGGDALDEVAASLLRHGLAAAVVERRQPGAGGADFAAGFYAALSAGEPVDAAARRAMSAARGASPVLYTAMRDGAVFRFKGETLARLTALPARAFAAAANALRGKQAPSFKVPAWALLGAGGVALMGAGALAAVLLLDGGGGEGDGTAGGGNGPPTEAPPPTEPAFVERIVFTSLSAAGEREVEQVFSMSSDGRDRKPLTSGTGGAAQADAASDCSLVVFVSGSGEASQIVVLDVASGAQMRLAAPPGPKMEPALSPDGRRVVFAVETGRQQSKLFVMDVEGDEARPLTGGSFDEQDASWSPDGRSIAFTSDRDAPRRNHEIYRIDVDGAGEPQRLTTQPGFDGEPAWSPDGTQIAFQSVREESDPNDFSIWVMDAASGDQAAGLQRLTDQPGREHDPAWSPDGSMIAYTYEEDGIFDVFVVDASGAGRPVRLTDAETRDTRPSWCRGAALDDE